MDGWWLKAQGDLRIAEPATMVIVSNYGSMLDEFCGFTTHAHNAFMWCRGDLERIAASLKEDVTLSSFTDTTFWKAP